MSKTMKKLICALLSGTMLLSSFGLVGFASEVADDTTTEVSDTATDIDSPDAEDTEDIGTTTDETETAEAPTTGADSATQIGDDAAYANDTYYQRALALTSALGIISGYTDGSIKPGSNVTRAEMTSILLRTLGITATSGYNNVYTDVSSNHWAAAQIQTATDQGIIAGMGDGTFQPDANVTYAQVCVMLVNALNYGPEAVAYGGWPNGFLNIASSVLNITDNAQGNSEEPAERGLVIKMVFNALLGPYKNPRGTENGVTTYSTNKSLGEVRFDVKEGKGILKATATTSITGVKPLAGQVIIDVADDANDDDNGTLYETTLTDIDAFVGSNIVYYYQDRASMGERVLAIASNGARSRTEEIKAEDIEEITGFNGNDGVASIKVYGSNTRKRFEEDKEPTIVYNGQTITSADLQLLIDKGDARGYKYYYNANGDKVDQEPITMNDFIKPKMGTIRLIDSDSNGRFETIVVEKYETMVISAATANRLTGKIDNVTVSLVDLDDTDKIVTVTSGGDEVRVRNLKKNDVASIKRDLDEEVIDIVVTGESFTGKITSSGSLKTNSEGIVITDDDLVISVDGTKYSVDRGAIADVGAGKECIFHTDAFGRIAYLETVTASGMLQAGEKYGWIMSAYESESGEAYIVRMMTEDGMVEMELGSSLELWTNAAGYHRYTGSDNVNNAVKALLANNAGFIKVSLKSGESVPIRLVKYKVNSNNVISRLYCAVDKNSESNTEALRIYATDLRSVAVSGGLVDGYNITDGLLEISVPKKASEMGKASSYSYGEVNSSKYVVRENGSGENFILAEFTSSTTPTLLIRFTDSADEVVKASTMDNVANNPTMVVDSVDLSYDKDDNEVYTINGYSNGSPVSVTTTSTTQLAQMTVTGGVIINNDRVYNTRELWNAQDASLGNLSDYLEEGDLLLYEGGTKLIRLYDADEIYNQLIVNGLDQSEAKQTAGDFIMGIYNNFNTRNIFIGQRLVDFDEDDVAWIELAGGAGMLSFESSKVMTLIEINHSTGRVSISKETADIATLQEYNQATHTGDFIFARLCDKGNLQEIVVYRFI